MQYLTRVNKLNDDFRAGKEGERYAFIAPVEEFALIHALDSS